MVAGSIPAGWSIICNQYLKYLLHYTLLRVIHEKKKGSGQTSFFFFIGPFLFFMFFFYALCFMLYALFFIPHRYHTNTHRPPNRDEYLACVLGQEMVLGFEIPRYHR